MSPYKLWCFSADDKGELSLFNSQGTIFRKLQYSAFNEQDSISNRHDSNVCMVLDLQFMSYVVPASQRKTHEFKKELHGSKRISAQVDVGSRGQ